MRKIPIQGDKNPFIQAVILVLDLEHRNLKEMSLVSYRKKIAFLTFKALGRDVHLERSAKEQGRAGVRFLQEIS